MYECRCVKCNLAFFAESKRALICRRCKPVGMTETGDRIDPEECGSVSATDPGAPQHPFD